jgi:hypothetical protein
MSTWKCESKKWATAAIRYVAAGHTIGETLRVCGLRAHRAHGTLTAHTGACARARNRKPAKSDKKHLFLYFGYALQAASDMARKGK